MSDRKEYKHNWYLKNKERIRKNQKEYTESHKKELSKKHHEYYKKHREEILKKIKAYQFIRLSEMRKKSKKYYQEHKEELRAKRLDKNRIKNGLKPFHYEKYLNEKIHGIKENINELCNFIDSKCP